LSWAMLSLVGSFYRNKKKRVKVKMSTLLAKKKQKTYGDAVNGRNVGRNVVGGVGALLGLLVMIWNIELAHWSKKCN